MILKFCTPIAFDVDLYLKKGQNAKFMFWVKNPILEIYIFQIVSLNKICN